MSALTTTALSSEEVAARADLPLLVAAMREAFVSGQRARAEVPKRSLIVRQSPFGVFGSMPAFSAHHDLFVTKVAAFVDKSAQSGPPSVHALVVAFNGTSGQPIALLDGAAVTNLKCAAIAALVTDYCALPQAKTLGLLGTGAQARQQVRGVLSVRGIEEIRVFSRNPGNVARFIDHMAPLAGANVRFVAARSANDAVADADIVGTTTTSSQPVFSTTHLPRHLHVNCMGAHTTTSREVTHEFLRSSVVVVEDRTTALEEAGDVHRSALEIEQLVAREDLHGERTVFSSTGHAFLDLLTAAHLLRAVP